MADSANQQKHSENCQSLSVSERFNILRLYPWKQTANDARNVNRDNDFSFTCRRFVFYFITLRQLFCMSMKRFFLVPVLFLATLTTVDAARLKNEIQRIWSVQKVETTDQSLNYMIKDYDFSKLLVEFTKSGAVLLSGKDTGTKYSVAGNKIVLSEGVMMKEIQRAELKASIKSDNLTVDLPADLVKQILLTAKDMYLKSGGEVFVAKMIENAAKTYSIEAVIILKRK
jgi:hypothetical protein